MCTVGVPPGTGLGNTGLDHVFNLFIFYVFFNYI